MPMCLAAVQKVIVCGAALGLLACCGAPATANPTTATPVPSSSPLPQTLRMVVLGDSIASGTAFGGQGSSGWPAIVAQKLGLLSLLSAQPGTGYTKDYASGFAYTARVDQVIALKPSILIVEGSRNDTDPTATKQAVTEVLGRLRDALPQAKILVIGPLYLDRTDGRTTPINDAVKTVASRLGLTYVDTIKARWFTGSARSMIASDGIHPTDQGHRYLASLVLPLVSRMLPVGYVMPTGGP